MSKELARNDQGAILIIGLAMGLLMVSALWNIVSMGDAMIWRERLQDAADAAAFESSVWNARGMNIIAFLNIVMSAAMAILVALRGIIIITSALLAVLYAMQVACVFLILVPSGITQALCPLVTSAPRIIQPVNNWATRTERAWEPRVKKVIEGLQKGQQIVATITPVIGLTQSLASSSQQYDMLAVGVSSSMIPSNTRASGAVVWDDVRDAMPRIGRGVSLPVSLEGEWKLCEMAGRFVPNELMALLGEAGIKSGFLDSAGGFFRNFIGKVTGSLPALFCGTKAPSQIAGLQDDLRAAAGKSCEAAKKKGMVTKDHNDPNWDVLEPFQKYWKRRNGPIIVDPNGVADAYDFDEAACQKDEVAKQNAAHKPERGYKSARVWRYTQNGDLFMYSWGFSYKDPPWLKQNDRGLTYVENFNAANLVAPPDDLWKLGLAQAEMYHDCRTNWTACSNEAMWKMRWKARLRRLHDPRDLAVRSLSHIATAELINVMHKYFAKLVQFGEGRLGAYAAGRGGPLELITSFLRGNFYDTAIFNRGTQYGLDIFGTIAGSTVGKLLSQQPVEPENTIIH